MCEDSVTYHIVTFSESIIQAHITVKQERTAKSDRQGLQET